MIRPIMLALLATAAPALGQQPVPAVPPAAGQPVAPATPAPTPAQPAASSDPASIIDREFPSYDRNADGLLDRTEFSSWMGKLKTIADPTLPPDAPSLQTWLGAAFVQADLDRSQGVTKTELTGFLLPGRPVAAR